MMHISERKTAGIFTKRMRKDAYYWAAFSTENEAEADRIGILYMALAGYDPRAAGALWQRAHLMRGSDPGFYLYTHPLNAQRMQLAAQTAEEVMRYYAAGKRNENWASLLGANVLYQKRASPERQVGAGITKAVEAAAEIMIEHDRAKTEAKARQRAARQTADYHASLVRLLQVANDPQGRPLVWMQFQNGSQQDVAAIGVTVHYLGGGGQPLYKDPTCGGPATLGVNQTLWLNCSLRQIQGATSYSVQVTGVQFR